MTFLSPKTHIYIHLPTKWGYTNIDSSTQPSGDISDTNCLYMTEILRHSSHTYRGYNLHHMTKRDSSNDYNRQRQTIMSLDMTFTLNDIHDIYNRDQACK